MKAIFISLAVFGSVTLAQAQLNFDANLDGLQEVPPNASPGYGSADFTLVGTNLSVDAGTGSYVDLLGNTLTAQIRDAAVGVNGPLVFTLTLDNPGTTTGSFSGSGVLTTPQITDLDAGNLYLNITSNVFPSGEIRGQILPVPEPTTLALAGMGTLALLAVRRKI